MKKPIHAALRLPEILHSIFDDIAEDTEESINLKPNTGQALLRAALVCRSFLSPALDALWKRMDSLVPLLSLVRAFQKVNNVYVLIGDISDGECVRVESYARRVRLIQLDTDAPEERMAPSVYFQLAQTGFSPLFPSLRTFRWIHKNTLNPHILLFVTATLVNIKLVFTGYNQPLPAHDLSSFLNAVLRKAPLLEYLELEENGPQMSLDSVKDFKNLRYLSLPGSVVPKTLYRALCDMEYLVELRLGLDDSSTANGDVLLGKEFRSLQRITLTGAISHCASFLDKLLANRLNEVVVRQLSGIVDNEVVRSMSSKLRYPNLRRICISILSDLPLHNDLEVKYVFGPLFSLRKLEALTISIDYAYIVMDDQDVICMVKAWPNLKSLRIGDVGGEQIPTIESLVFLAQHCPALVELGLPIDADTFTSKPVVFSIVLKSINICGWRFSASTNLREVARVLDSLFPALDMTQMKQMIPFGVEGEICDMIQLFQDVRKDHEMRLRSFGLVSGSLESLPSHRHIEDNL